MRNRLQEGFVVSSSGPLADGIDSFHDGNLLRCSRGKKLVHGQTILRAQSLDLTAQEVGNLDGDGTHDGGSIRTKSLGSSTAIPKERAGRTSFKLLVTMMGAVADQAHL